jgi:hypothetical protein
MLGRECHTLSPDTRSTTRTRQALGVRSSARIRSAANESIQEYAAGRPVDELLRRFHGRIAYLRRTSPGAAGSIDGQLSAAGIPERAS